MFIIENPSVMLKCKTAILVEMPGKNQLQGMLAVF